MPPTAGQTREKTTTRGSKRNRSPASRVKHSKLVEAITEISGGKSVTAAQLVAKIAKVDRDKITAIVDALNDVLVVQASDGLDPNLWGTAPTDDDLAEARRRADEIRRHELDRALAGSLTREEVARWLDVSPQAVSKRTSAGQLVVLRRGSRRLYPRWQFSDDATVPGLAELISRFPSPLALSSWATIASPDLDGLTPAEALGRRDGQARVLELAHSVGPAAW